MCDCSDENNNLLTFSTTPTNTKEIDIIFKI